MHPAKLPGRGEHLFRYVAKHHVRVGDVTDGIARVGNNDFPRARFAYTAQVNLGDFPQRQSRDDQYLHSNTTSTTPSSEPKSPDHLEGTVTGQRPKEPVITRCPGCSVRPKRDNCAASAAIDAK